jgi:hypothetical protein
MASASVVFTDVSGYADFIDAKDIASQIVASGDSSSVSPSGKQYAYITALGGNIWLAFTTDGTVANTANVSSRIPLSTDESITFYIRPGTRVGVLDRT